MKKGFTLIELLAVIVILAIIAVIAVPIVLNIIDETKNNAGLRSAEMYIKAAELSIAQSTLKDVNISDGEYALIDGDICIGTLSNNECNGKILEVEVNGKVPESGIITITNGNISDLSIVLNEKTIVKNSDGDLVYQDGETIEKGKFSSVCKPAEGAEYNTSAGTKYLCKVDPNKDPYTFYVLTTTIATDTSINLIMDRNICEDGTPTEAGKICLVAYNSSGDAAETGPVTAMSYLNNATSTWENIDNLNITYDDEGENFTGFALNGKARLPYKSEVARSNGTNEYLYEYLDGSDWYGTEGKQPTNNISGIYGYWTLSSNASKSSLAWYVTYDGYVDIGGVGYVNKYGARPVINLKI